MRNNYFKFFSNYLQKFIKQQIIGVCILAIFSLSKTLYPFFISLIIDEGITKNNYNNLIQYTFLMLIVIGISIIFNHIKILFFFNLGREISLKIRNDILKNLFSFSTKFYREYKHGDIITMLDLDVNNIQKFYTNILNNILANILIFLGMSIIVIDLSWEIYLLSFFSMFLYLIKQKKMGGIIKGHFYKTRVQKGEVESLTQEIVADISNIQLSNKKTFFLDKYNSEYNKYYFFSNNLIKQKSRTMILDKLYEAINLVLVLFVGGYMVLHDYLSIGSLFALTIYIQKLAMPMVEITNSYLEIKKIQASIDKLYEVLNNKEYYIKSGNVFCLEDINISIKNMSFAYDRNYLFDNFVLDIVQGDKVAIVGENGCGKSTLMNIITKLEGGYNGEIYIGTHNIADINIETFFNTIFYIMQNPFIFTGTIFDNLLMGSESVANEDIEEALTLVNLKDDIKKMKNGIFTEIGKNGIKLSKGQSQKLALARLFIHKTYPIIILDEPTASLDLETEKYVLDNIFKHMKNSTIIVITHREKVFEYCNKILRIKKDSGKHDDSKNDRYFDRAANKKSNDIC